MLIERVVIYILSDTKTDQVIWSFIQEKGYLIYMVQSLFPNFFTLNWGSSSPP